MEREITNKRVIEAAIKVALEAYDRHNAAAEKYGTLVLAEGKEEYRPLWYYHSKERARYRRMLYKRKDEKHEKHEEHEEHSLFQLILYFFLFVFWSYVLALVLQGLADLLT